MFLFLTLKLKKRKNPEYEKLKQEEHAHTYYQVWKKHKLIFLLLLLLFASSFLFTDKKQCLDIWKKFMTRHMQLMSSIYTFLWTKMTIFSSISLKKSKIIKNKNWKAKIFFYRGIVFRKCKTIHSIDFDALDLV